MLKLNKKGVGVGQVFLFIIAAITFSLIMIFGYRIITGVQETGTNVAFTQFKTSLESDIQRIYTEYDSVRTVNYRPPAEFQQVCFIDFDYDPAPNNPEVLQQEIQELCAYDPIACGIWEDLLQLPVTERYANAEQNVFLQPIQPVPIKTQRVSIYDQQGRNKVKGFLCQEIVGGEFPLILIGKGDRTGLISTDGLEQEISVSG